LQILFLFNELNIFDILLFVILHKLKLRKVKIFTCLQHCLRLTSIVIFVR